MLSGWKTKTALLGAVSLVAAATVVGASARLAAAQSPQSVPVVRQEVVPAIGYNVLRSGPQSGHHPTRNSLVKLRYTGRFPDGKEFGTSLGNKPDGTTIFPQYMLIPGCQSVLMLMRPGDRWQVTIPPEQAYGLTGHSLAGKTLVFDLELVDFVDQPPVPLPNYTALPKP